MRGHHPTFFTCSRVLSQPKSPWSWIDWIHSLLTIQGTIHSSESCRTLHTPSQIFWTVYYLWRLYPFSSNFWISTSFYKVLKTVEGNIFLFDLVTTSVAFPSSGVSAAFGDIFANKSALSFQCDYLVLIIWWAFICITLISICHFLCKHFFYKQKYLRLVLSEGLWPLLAPGHN